MSTLTKASFIFHIPRYGIKAIVIMIKLIYSGIKTNHMKVVVLLV
jgi:hypothetical protein